MANRNDRGEGGVLFPVSKRTEKGPAMDGKLTIDGDIASYIFEKLKEGKTPVIRLAAWSRMGQQNKKFLSLAADIPWDEHPDNPNRGGGRQGGVRDNYERRGSPPPYGGGREQRQDSNFDDDMSDSIPF